MKVVAQYEDRVKGKKVTVYDVRNSGIAFEMTAENGRKKSVPPLPCIPGEKM